MAERNRASDDAGTGGDETRKDDVGETAATIDSQPDRFPIDFDEWASSRRRYERIMVAGFRATVRAAGDLTRRRSVDEWNAVFAAFGGEEG